MSLIEFSLIKKAFKQKEVLKGVSFSVNKGEIFGLIGASGGGKSTLFNILMGLVREDSGIVKMNDQETTVRSKDLRKSTGFATQSNMIFEELSTKENAFYFGSLYGLKRKEVKERLQSLLGMLSLSGFENTYVRNLSGGMKKRANLLIALIHKPELLILDEPTVGLDPILRAKLWDYILEINKTGTTILVSSHLMDEIEIYCHKIAILKNGKIVTIGDMNQYRSYYGQDKNLKVIFGEIMNDESL